MIVKVLAARRTFLSEQKLCELALAVQEMPERGAIVEAGCALGGSAAVLTAAKNKLRPLYLYDVFGLIPAPQLRDGLRAIKFHLLNRLRLRRGFQGDAYYGYRQNLLGEIQTFFAQNGLPFEENEVRPVQGRYDQTLASPAIYEVALAHIDCDWYASVLTCLKALEPKLVEGGRLVMDDYYDFPGCRDAVNDHFAGNGRRELYSFIGRPDRAVMHIVRREK